MNVQWKVTVWDRGFTVAKAVLKLDEKGNVVEIPQTTCAYSEEGELVKHLLTDLQAVKRRNQMQIAGGSGTKP